MEVVLGFFVCQMKTHFNIMKCELNVKKMLLLNLCVTN